VPIPIPVSVPIPVPVPVSVSVPVAVPVPVVVPIPVRYPVTRLVAILVPIVIIVVVIVAPIERHAHEHRSAARFARDVGRREMDRIHAPVATARALGAQIHSAVSADHGVGTRIPIPSTVDGFVGGDPGDRDVDVALIRIRDILDADVLEIVVRST
jgi:hypothetical protein